MKSKNNWYVITGAPSSGKTTLIKQLEEKGYYVIHEVAREYIDKEMAKGKTIEEIRKNERHFQDEVLKMKIDLEKKLSKNKIIFFDRGIPDSLAYYKLYGWKVSQDLQKAVDECWYKKIFLLDFYDFKKDYARTESREQQVKIHDLMEKTYRETKIPLEIIPKMEIKEHRAKHILKNL
ncbi:MAG: ATP-binding protein [Parcubacteria group bacterium]|jgi:predicted ATPase